MMGSRKGDFKWVFRKLRRIGLCVSSDDVDSLNRKKVGSAGIKNSGVFVVSWYISGWAVESSSISFNLLRIVAVLIGSS